MLKIEIARRRLIMEDISTHQTVSDSQGLDQPPVLNASKTPRDGALQEVRSTDVEATSSSSLLRTEVIYRSRTWP
jgi:hypothetical protein